MIIEIQAKTLLSHNTHPDPWFGIKYTMNIYRGCEHQCIYCDSRSECYQIENFKDVLVKVNAIDLLKKELPRKRSKGRIGTGSMSDPYTPAEKHYNLTGQALEVIAQHGFPVLVTTKSDLVLKDLDTLVAINQVQACVVFTVTTAEDELSKKVEPGAPPSSHRFGAMKILAERGILTGVTLMPVLPFIEDNEANITRIVEMSEENGASFILPAFAMTLRDRQRTYYYEQLDRLFPGVRAHYERKFGLRYEAPAENARQLEQLFKNLCARHGIATRMPAYDANQPHQLELF